MGTLVPVAASEGGDVDADEAGSLARPVADPDAPPAIGVHAVRKDFRGIAALQGVSLVVDEHEILGIIGPNGAGKTTLFNVIAGSIRPTSGRVTYGERDITRLAPDRRLRLGIARTFQLIHPFKSLTVLENVIVAATGSGMAVRAARSRVATLMEWLGLDAIATKPASEVNAVEGKRLELAKAVATDPKVLLLDEVFSGLNREEVAELAELVRILRDQGRTVLMIEHNVSAIRSVADRVVAMSSGAIISTGTPEEVLTAPVVVESYLGRSTAA